MATPAITFMKGGAKEYMADIIEKYHLPIEVVVTLTLVTGIVFIGKIPLDIRKQADTTIGRALLLTITASIALLFGWPLGILAALMSALLIGAGGIHEKVIIKKGEKREHGADETKEAFAPDMNIRIIPDKHKWLIERVLGENPLMIEDNTVSTSAIQDLSEKNPVSNGSVQSNSVSR